MKNRRLPKRNSNGVYARYRQFSFSFFSFSLIGNELSSIEEEGLKQVKKKLKKQLTIRSVNMK